MATGRGWGGASHEFQPPRAGLCQRRPSLSKEGSSSRTSVSVFRFYYFSRNNLLLTTNRIMSCIR